MFKCFTCKNTIHSDDLIHEEPVHIGSVFINYYHLVCWENQRRLARQSQLGLFDVDEEEWDGDPDEIYLP